MLFLAFWLRGATEGVGGLRMVVVDFVGIECVAVWFCGCFADAVSVCWAGLRGLMCFLGGSLGC